MSELDLNSLNR